MTQKADHGRVLLIDDSQLAVGFLRITFEEWGWTTKTALTGRDGIEAAAQWRPDVIICDLHMPDVNGLDVLENVHKHDPDLPVVVHSSEDSLNAVLQAIHQGAFDYVLKLGEDTRPLKVAAERALAHARVVRENQRLLQELLDTQEVLVHAQKTAAVAQLCARVSHEINNPLGGLIGMLQLARAKEEKETRRYQELEEMEKQALRIAEVVKNVHALSGEFGVSTAAACDVHALLSTCLSTLKTQLDKKGIDVRCELVAADRKVRGNAQELSDMFLELFRNATEAMTTGGTLRVETASEDQGIVKIRISDSGGGDRADRQHHEGQQSKGLSRASEIIETHKGKMRLTNQPDRGTTVEITLPGCGSPSLV